jgi:PAS domain S-box-containing protein
LIRISPKMQKNQKDSVELHFKLLNEIYAHEGDSQQEFLDFALHQVLKLSESKYGYIYFYDEETKLFHLNSWSKDVMKDCEVIDPQTCYELDKTGFWGEAVRQRNPLINNNFQISHLHKKGYPQGHVPIKKFLTAPVFDKNKIVAVVGVANKSTDYTNKDVTHLQLLINSVWEINKRKEFTQKYQQTFQALEQAKTSVVITDTKGNIEYVNPFFSHITGYSFKEVKGKNPRELKSGHQSKAYYKNLWDTITSGETWRGELKNITKKGKEYWEEAVISPLKDSNGKITHFVAVKNDITKQKEALDNLSTSERLLSQAEGIALLGGWEYDVKSNTIEWTNGLFTLHGLSLKTKKDKIQESLKCYSKEDSKKIETAFQNCISTGKGYDLTLPFKNLKGKRFWIRTKTEAFKVKNKVVKVFGVVQDVSKEIKQKENLQRSKDLADKAFQVSDSGSFYFDINSQTFQWHPNAQKLLKLNHDTCTWDFLKERFHPEDKQKVIAAFENACEGSDFEIEHRFKIGAHVWWIKAQGELVYNSQNQPKAVVGFVQDFTKRKVAEETSKENLNLLAAIAANIPRAYLSVIYADFKIGFTSGEELHKKGLLSTNLFGSQVEDNYKSYGEDILNKVKYHYYETLKGKKQDFELFLDGQYQAFSTNPLFDDKGNVPKFLVIVRDITKEKETALKIAESERFKTSVIDSLSEGLVVHDLSGKIILANQAAANILGLSMNQLLGKTSYDPRWKALNKDGSPLKPAQHPAMVTLKTGKPVDHFIMNVNTGKIRRIIKINSRPITDQNNKVFQVVASFEDITLDEELKEEILLEKNKFESMIEYSNIGIALANNIGVLLQANPMLEKMLGYKKGALEGKSFKDFSHPDELSIEIPLVEEIIKGKRNSYRLEKRYLTKYKTRPVIWCDVSVSAIRDKEGNLLNFIATHIDITDKKKGEIELKQSKQHFEDLFQSHENVGLAQTDLKGGFIRFNNALLKIFEINADQLKKLNIADLSHPKYFEKEGQLIQEILEGNRTAYRLEKQIKTPKGYKWVDLSVTGVFDEENKISYFLGSAIDIDSQKKGEFELSKSQELLERAQTVAKVGSWEYNYKTDGVTWSKELFNVFERDPKLGAPSFADQPPFYTKESYEKLNKLVHKCIRTGEPYNVELEIITGKGNHKYIISKGQLEKDENKNVIGLYGTAQDITEKKQYELKLKESALLLESSQNIAQLGSWELDHTTNLVKWSSQTFKIFELKQNTKKVTFDLTLSFIHPDDRKIALETFKNAISKGIPYDISHRIITTTGKEKRVNVKANTVFSSDGIAIKTTGTIQDVTEKFLIELEIKKSKALLERAQRITHMGNWEYNINTDEVEWSDEIFRVFEYPKEKGTPNFADQAPLFSENSFNKLKNVLEECICNATPYEVEFDIITSSGKRKIIIGKGEPELDKNNNVISLYGTIQDVTEIKKLELDIQKTKEQLQYALEGTQAGSWDWYVQTGETIFNERWAKIIGYTLEELSPISIKTWEKYSHPEDLKYSGELLKKHFKGELAYYSCRARMKHKKGHWVWVWDRGKVVEWDNDGNPIRMVGTHVDVTEWIKAEQELKESQNKYQDLYDNAPALFVSVDPKTGLVVNCNQTLCNKTGYTKEEIIGKPIFDRYHTVEAAKEAFVEFVKTGKVKDKELALKRKDGTHFPVLLNVTSVYDEEGNIIQSRSVWQDISEIREAQKILKENEEKFRLIYQTSGMGLGYYDPKGYVVEFNQPGLDFLGKSMDEVRGKHITEIIPGESGKEYHQRILKAVQEDKTHYYLDEIPHKGKSNWFRSYYSTIKNNIKETIGVLILSIDSSDQINTQKQLINSEANYRFLTEAIPQVVWSANSEGVIDFINQNGLNYIGKPLDDLKENGWFSIIHQDCHERVIEKWNKAQKEKHSFENEQRMLIHSGNYHWFKVTATPQIDEQGNILKWVGLSIDIQKEKEAELQELKSKKEIEFIAKYAKKGIEAKSPDEIFFLVAEGVYELLEEKSIVTVAKNTKDGKRWTNAKARGLEKWMKYFPKGLQIENLEGKTNPLLMKAATKSRNIVTLGNNIHELSMGSVPKLFSDIAAKIFPSFSVKAINIFKDKDIYGNVSFVEFKDTPSINKEVLFTFLNEASTTLEKLSAKMELEESNLRFQLASAATKDVVWDWDVETGEFIWGNSVFTVFGDLELKGHIDDWWNNIHTDDLERIKEELYGFMNNNKIDNYELEYRFRRADDTYADVFEVGSILRDKKKKAVRLVGAIRDITESKSYLKQIEKQNKRLQTISWIQSHELRAPLSRILGIAELLKEKDLDKDLSDELIENIIHSSKELDNVVRSIVSKTDLKLS